tara:strand:- start:2924 stop:3679 length:756 start_codon:yes stop_codon:yes gene_type:complete
MQNTIKPLSGQVALVTGGSRGIGKQIAKDLAELGADIAINYNNSKQAALLVKNEITNNNGKAEIYQCNVGNNSAVNEMMNTIQKQMGNINILINNAGISRERTVRNMSLDEWEEVINTNLNSVFYCSQSVIPQMIENKKGTIINIASLLGQIGNIGLANYSASKGGVLAFTRGLALELARYNITVNSICPGWIKTDMTDRIPEQLKEGILSSIPLKKFGEPEDISEMVSYLILKGSYITGTQIHINGGLYM